MPRASSSARVRRTGCGISSREQCPVQGARSLDRSDTGGIDPRLGVTFRRGGFAASHGPRARHRAQPRVGRACDERRRSAQPRGERRGQPGFLPGRVPALPHQLASDPRRSDSHRGRQWSIGWIAQRAARGDRCLQRAAAGNARAQPLLRVGRDRHGGPRRTRRGRGRAPRVPVSRSDRARADGDRAAFAQQRGLAAVRRPVRCHRDPPRWALARAAAQRPRREHAGARLRPDRPLRLPDPHRRRARADHQHVPSVLARSPAGTR